MSKRVKSMVILLTLILLIPTTALGASFGGANVVDTPDGKEIQYYMEYNGTVFTDLPQVIRTLTPGTIGNTARYDVNLISNSGGAGVTHEIMKTGGYLEVNNVLRESSLDNQRLLFTRGPVTLKFSGDYLDARSITEYDRADVSNGTVLYNISLDYRTEKTYSKELMHVSNTADQTYTLDKPGLYQVIFKESIASGGVSAYIYVAGPNEDVSYTSPTPSTATPTTVNVYVDGNYVTAPAYTINGRYYLRLRDIGYLLNGTAKQFDVITYLHKDDINIKTMQGGSTYHPVGGELSAIDSSEATANPSDQKVMLNGFEVNPSVYSINGTNYMDLLNIASIDDFGIAVDYTANNVAITTAASYGKLPPVAAKPITVGAKERLAGNDRFQTAVAISQKGWTKADNVVITDGNDYHNALVGSSFAYLKDAPILLTAKDLLNSDTSAEITRLGAKTVYILGDTNSVSSAVENELKQKYNVVRIGGTDVETTSIQVAEQVRSIKTFDTVALAVINNFPDALAIAPYSAKDTMPILYSTTNGFGYPTRKALQDWGIKNVVIAGGTGVISTAVENDLKSMGINVTRLSGQDRYATALEILKYFGGTHTFTDVSIATGENYPDCLAGAVFAAKNNMPVVLAEKDSVKSTITDYLNGHGINKAYVFGGTGVVADNIMGTGN